MQYSKFTGVVAWSGGTTTLRHGMAIDDGHPLLDERPELFGPGNQTADIPNRTHGTTPAQPPVVESTMQTGPGGGRVRKVQGQ